MTSNLVSSDVDSEEAVMEMEETWMETLPARRVQCQCDHSYLILWSWPLRLEGALELWWVLVDSTCLSTHCHLR